MTAYPNAMFTNCAYLLCDVDATADVRLVRWVNCNQYESESFICVFEDEQRIEIIRSGEYRLHLHLDSDTEDGDANYFLQINGHPVTVFKPKELGASSDQSSFLPTAKAQVLPTATAATASEMKDGNEHRSSESLTTSKSVAVNVALVSQVYLDKWDLIVLRRDHLNRDLPDYLSFGRLILEPAVDKDEKGDAI